MRCRILIFTAGFGESHDAAARALAASANARYGDGCCRVANVFAIARPRRDALARAVRSSLTRWTPRLWRPAREWIEKAALRGGGTSHLAPEHAALVNLVARTRPDVLCSTHPAYAYLMRTLRGGYDLPPHFNVVTGPVKADPSAWNAGADGWFVPDAEVADALVRSGVTRERVHVLGFPVSPAFSHVSTPLAPPVADTVRPRVLYLLQSHSRQAVETAWRLLSREDWDVTCAVADNAPLEAELRGRAAERVSAAQVYGWTSEIPRLLMTHHIVITKAGSVTTHEAIAARCPLLVSQGSGGRAALVRRHDIGAIAESAEEVVLELQRAFANEAVVWRRWRSSIGRLARPNASRDIVAALLGELRPAAGV